MFFCHVLGKVCGSHMIHESYKRGIRLRNLKSINYVVVFLITFNNFILPLEICITRFVYCCCLLNSMVLKLILSQLLKAFLEEGNGLNFLMVLLLNSLLFSIYRK